MARYIDADGLIEKLQETICSKCNMYDGIKCKSCGIDDTLDFLENAPTADVVPKSEVDKTIAEWAYLHADVLNKLEKAKAEVAREIFEEIEERMLDGEIGGKYPTKLISPDTYAELKKKYTGETP